MEIKVNRNKNHTHHRLVWNGTVGVFVDLIYTQFLVEPLEAYEVRVVSVGVEVEVGKENADL